jgi:hypothetical protein
VKLYGKKHISRHSLEEDEETYETHKPGQQVISQLAGLLFS